MKKTLRTMNRTILLYLLFLSTSLYAQTTDWQKWGKAEVQYTAFADTAVQHSSVPRESLGGLIIENSRLLYKFFISDLDGNNCPFQPTCSSFFVQSVKATNLFQGMLMFADRFTRDMNLIKVNHYPYSKNMHLFDPVNNYLLIPDKIEYIPPSKVINE